MIVQQRDDRVSSGQKPMREAEPGELKFGAHNEFHTTLRKRVADYFQSTGQKPRDCPRMYLKTAIILTWFAVSYALLVFVVATWWLALPLVISLGLATAAIGFNIQHDGGHGAYSDRPWVNRLMALSLDLLGGSSYIWARKHNILHHTYSNITGHDDDLNIGVWGRLSPHRPRFNFHRLQHVYLWLLYGLSPMKWQLYDDFCTLITGHSGGRRLNRPTGWNLIAFIGGKAVFFTLALGIPLLLHPIWVVLLVYLMVTLVEGVTLNLVFQLAHCVADAQFPLPHKDTGRIETAWSVHQVETTVNFARRNGLISWFVGGLNFQIEHHLFPQICHIHYPAIAPIVEQTCQEFGVRYTAYPTFRAGVVAHYRWLRRMGMASPSG